MQLTRRNILAAGTGLILVACKGQASSDTAPGSIYDAGRIELWDGQLETLLDPGATLYKLGDGFAWSEGPVWDKRRGRLLFSDIPNNRMMSWNAISGLETFLEPAGRGHGEPDPHASPGTNGLYYEEATDSLLICNQDGRSIDRLNLESGERTRVVHKYKGRKFNSPNDIVRANNGTTYFTDPIYGLIDGGESAGIELGHRGVYSFAPDGSLSLLVDDMTLPNGIALSPDENTLYVTQSDPESAIIRRFALNADGSVRDGEIWVDLNDQLAEENPGLPDGMAVDQQGNVWATGPGGVFVIAPDGTLLGRIRTGNATANCAFGEDGSTLFITANDTLLRIETRSSGLWF